jgi:hypothetical protein
MPLSHQNIQENLWNLQQQSPYTKPLALWRVKNVLDASPLNARDLFEAQTGMQIPGLPRFHVPPLSLPPMQPMQPTVQPSVQPSVQPLEFLACQALSELGMKRVVAS